MLRRMDNDLAKNRKKMSYNGAVMITLVMDPRGKTMQEPQIALMGLAEDGPEGAFKDELAAIAQDAIEAMPKSTRLDDAAVRHTVAQHVRRFLKETHGKKPMTEVHVVRV
jgi:ribonuclease J